MNKVQKIREGIEKLKSQLLRGACSSQIAMETMCKEEAYNEVLAILDTMQEEPVSDELEKVVEEIVDPTVLNAYGVKEIANRLRRTMIEPVSEDLEEAIDTYLKSYWGGEKEKQEWPFLKKMVIYFAKWQKQNLWKPADGEDLPELERDVIVLTQPYPLEGSEYAVSFGHRPNPNGWDRKSITTGEIKHYTPETYDKRGWNIPDIKWWLDIDLPKEK